MQVIWSIRAHDRLRDIMAFIAVDDPERAVTFVAELVERADALLRAHPHAGRRVPESHDPRVRELVLSGYRIPYRVAEHVEVITVFEGHKQLPRDLVGHDQDG